MRAIERKTGREVVAVKALLSNNKDGWAIEDLEGNLLGAYAESTFKKNYRLADTTISSEDTKEEIQVKIATFTGMEIQGTYTATRVGKTWEVPTAKKGILTFDAKGIQVGAKNPKFANHLIFA